MEGSCQMINKMKTITTIATAAILFLKLFFFVFVFASHFTNSHYASDLAWTNCLLIITDIIVISTIIDIITEHN